jgi:hypothetical protein
MATIIPGKATTIPGMATGIPGMATTIPARHPKVVAFRLVSVVAFDWNGWSPSTGICKSDLVDGGDSRAEGFAHQLVPVAKAVDDRAGR